MSLLHLTASDKEQLKSQGIDEFQVYEQIDRFKKGTRPVNLVKAARENDGITCFDSRQRDQLIAYFDETSASLELVKFVPASGAATRMFKTLLYFNNNFEHIDALEAKASAEQGNKDYCFLFNFISGIQNKEFAFIEDLQQSLASAGFNLDQEISKNEFKNIIHYLLTPDGLNYASLPKALLKFHRYTHHCRTAIEEHLVEGKSYARNNTGDIYLHFTISPQFQDDIQLHLEKVLPLYKDKGTHFHIDFSHQKSSTNTIAVDENNELFRDIENRLVLRPGGHGALIDNLNALDEDIVFIKNIDNVVPDRLKQETTLYKKMLAGCLLKEQAKIFQFLKQLDEIDVTRQQLEDIARYVERHLNITFPEGISHSEMPHQDKKAFLQKKLNRPIRVCGMVRNEGEPGGGPFWVKEKDDTLALHIIEGAQIDHESESHRQIAAQATHFNPVDLVCGIKDFKGNKFDLKKFVDNDAYFISEKSQDGKHLKALELPGLWNGAMADWISIFVEVPIETFNPIKTVNDLLRPQHL